jgi:hypothetical protein
MNQKINGFIMKESSELSNERSHKLSKYIAYRFELQEYSKSNYLVSAQNP